MTSILSTGALWAGGGGGLTTATGSFQNRAGNSVRYDSPSYSGFNGSVEYDTRESANHAGIISIGGAYANGPLQLGTAYTRNRKVRGVDFDDSAFSATAAYKFDIVRIAGVYEHPDYEVASGDLKRDFWGISGTMSAGPGQLYLFYGDAAKGKGSVCDITTTGCTARIGGLAKGDQTDSQQYEISYTTALSKRTLAYVGYIKINNSRNAAYTFDINPYAIAPGAKPAGLVAGMAHFF